MHLVLNQAGAWQLLLLNASIRFSATVQSSIACIAAAVLLLPLDYIRLSSTGFHFDDLLYASDLHFISILVLLPALQIGYFLLRFLGAMAGRLHGAGGFLTGVSLFLLIQPAASVAASVLLPGLHWSIAPVAVLLVGLLAAFPLIALVPDLRGENAPLLTLSSGLAWIFSDHPDDSILNSVFDLRDRLVLACAFYLWLQIRRRLHRSPVYTPFAPSLRSQIIIGASIAVLAVLAILDSATTWIVSLFLLLSWLFTARFLPGRAQQNQSAGRLAQLLLLAYVLGGLSFLHILRLPEEAPAVSSRLLRSQSTSGRILLNLAVFFDNDFDGNSRWPGQDPEDQDPCIRKDGLNRCRRLTRFSPEPAAARILLVSRMADLSQRSDSSETAFFLASNRAEEALLSIARAADGLSVSSGQQGDSVFSQLSEQGYRTICIFVGLKHPYAARLNHGCQVFLEVDNEETAFASVRRYEEKRTFAWIHSEAAASVAPSPLPGYQMHQLELDLHRQTGLYKGDRSAAAPLLSSDVLPVILGQEGRHVEDAADIRHMEIGAPWVFKLLGLDASRFMQSVRYSRRSPDGSLTRKTTEAYTGASNVSGPGDVP